MHPIVAIERWPGLFGRLEGLYSTEVFRLIQQEDERLAGDKEYNDVMNKLKEACDQDKSGRYQRILEQSRQGKVIH